MAHDVEQCTLAAYSLSATLLAQQYEAGNRSRIQSVMSSIFSPGSKVLELGCGSGADAAALLQHGVDIVALDGSAAMLDEAGRRHPELAQRLLHVMLPGKIPFADNSFDGIVASTLLMHFSTTILPSVCAEIARVTCPGGRLFLAVVSQRDDLDENGFDPHGRFFNCQNLSQIADQFASHGIVCCEQYIVSDALGRTNVVIEEGIFEKIPNV
jgi:ubiquinone/menaquinone biosynthesis C-methylase UbiE